MKRRNEYVIKKVQLMSDNLKIIKNMSVFTTFSTDNELGSK